MPYVKRTTTAGKTVEIEYYYTSRYQKRGQKRQDKVKPTREEQKLSDKKSYLYSDVYLSAIQGA